MEKMRKTAKKIQSRNSGVPAEIRIVNFTEEYVLIIKYRMVQNSVNCSIKFTL
jgi:hypothetical protein